MMGLGRNGIDGGEDRHSGMGWDGLSVIGMGYRVGVLMQNAV